MPTFNRPYSMKRSARSAQRRAAEWFGLRLALAAAGLLPCAQALALPGDAVQMFVEGGISHDSNVFRVSKSTVLPASASRSDTRMTATAGLLFDVPVSLQRFQGEASFSRNDYSENNALDFTGRSLRAAWLWQVGDPLSGELGITEARRLSSFNDAGIQADLLTIRRAYGSAAWMVAPRWRLQAGLLKQKIEHDIRLTEDIEVESMDMALNYVSRAENTIGLGLHQDDVAYPNNSGYDFKHRDIGLRGEWSITDKSRINGSIGLAERNFDSTLLKDHGSAVYRLTYDYQATENLLLTAVALRDFTPTEDVDTGSILIDSLALQPRFVLTEKITLGGNVEYASRDYVTSATGRKDHVRSIAAYLAYQPLLSLQIRLHVQHDQRTSDVVNDDYTANLASIYARLSF